MSSASRNVAQEPPPSGYRAAERVRRPHFGALGAIFGMVVRSESDHSRLCLVPYRNPEDMSAFYSCPDFRLGDSERYTPITVRKGDSHVHVYNQQQKYAVVYRRMRSVPPNVPAVSHEPLP